MFPWAHNAQRKRILDTPWPEEWEKILATTSAHAALLKGELRRKWQQTIQVLVAEKHWEGCEGLVITKGMRVTVAAQAALMLLGMQHDYFSKVRKLQELYPAIYKVFVEYYGLSTTQWFE